MSSNAVIIVGVSTRSAAASCVRAGLRPVCLDLFGDRDLREFAEVHVLDHLDDMVPLLEQLAGRLERSTPVIYTGGMEHRSDLIEYIESHWTLWGCSSRSVKEVRDPIRLAAALRDADCPVLEVRLDPPSADGNWLRKPHRSGGGLGIVRWSSPIPASPSECCFQEFRMGQPMSALFAAAAHARKPCELIGICKQLVGESWLHAPPFGWCGAIGNVHAPADTCSLLLKIGQSLHAAFNFAGLFGIDFILDDAGIPWVTEVNPRYTGSTEVLELSLGQSLISRHAECFDVPTALRIDIEKQAAHTRQQTVGKAILYAPCDLVADTREWVLPLPDAELPLVVDVPMHGQSIPAGGPVCSVLVKAGNALVCENALREFAGRIDTQIARWPRLQ